MADGCQYMSLRTLLGRDEQLCGHLWPGGARHHRRNRHILHDTVGRTGMRSFDRLAGSPPGRNSPQRPPGSGVLDTRIRTFCLRSGRVELLSVGAADRSWQRADVSGYAQHVYRNGATRSAGHSQFLYPYFMGRRDGHRHTARRFPGSVYELFRGVYCHGLRAGSGCAPLCRGHMPLLREAKDR